MADAGQDYLVGYPPNDAQPAPVLQEDLKVTRIPAPGMPGIDRFDVSAT
jgi:hypothetical protein